MVNLLLILFQNINNDLHITQFTSVNQYERIILFNKIIPVSQHIRYFPRINLSLAIAKETFIQFGDMVSFTKLTIICPFTGVLTHSVFDTLAI